MFSGIEKILGFGKKVTESLLAPTLLLGMCACTERQEASHKEHKPASIKVDRENDELVKKSQKVQVEDLRKSYEADINQHVEDQINRLKKTYEQGQSIGDKKEVGTVENITDRIYFAGKKNGQWDLYYKEGCEITRLTSTFETEDCLALSPDKSSLAYSQDTGPYRHIYIMDIKTRESSPIVAGPYLDSEPAWNPKIEEVAFTRNFGGFNSDVMVVDTETGEVKPLTKNDRMTPDHSPSYDPKGEKIAYISEKITKPNPDRDIIHSDRNVWLMNKDGSEKRQITKGIFPNSVPRWSQKGDRLVLEGIVDDYTTIVSVNPDGTELTLLLSFKDFSQKFPSLHFTKPSFSPDGREVIFEAYTITNPGEDTYSAFGIMDSDGNNLRFILDDFGLVRDPFWARLKH